MRILQRLALKLSITYEVDFELPRFETVRFGRNSIKYIGPLLVEVTKTLKNDRNSELV